MKLTTIEKQYIVNRYQTGESVDKLSVSIGISINAIKRALADMKVLNLSWYKTEDQHRLLTHLESLNVKTVSELQSYINNRKGI